jgi:shikimate dehydrogenase
VATAASRPARRQIRNQGALVGQRGWSMSSPDRYAVIGHPVHHSRSPFIHARFAAQTGQAISYTTIDATPEMFGPTAHEFFSGGGKGLNVTIPHKEAAAQLVDELTPRAQRAGAVNLMAARRDGSLLGDNADGAGLVRDLVANHHVDIAGCSILLLGAGGAARGVLAPLLELKPRELTIVNRNLERAHALAQYFADLGSLRATGYDELQGKAYDLVINATATSLSGALPPLPPGVVNAHSTCYDLAYGKDGTAFTRWAQRLGCAQAITGLGMLVEQAAESFYLWRGVRPETAPVLAALAAELRS